MMSTKMTSLQFIWMNAAEENSGENHIAAAAHLEAAARHHRQAARLLSSGNTGKAKKSLHAAQSHHYLAMEYAGIKGK